MHHKWNRKSVLVHTIHTQPSITTIYAGNYLNAVEEITTKSPQAQGQAKALGSHAESYPSSGVRNSRGPWTQRARSEFNSVYEAVTNIHKVHVYG